MNVLEHRAPTSVQTLWPDEAATQATAAQLAQGIRAWWGQGCASDTALQIQLRGDLGAGKTTFSRALLRALGHSGRVKSPTYTLCEPYHITWADKTVLPLPVFHFDLYRMADPDEWEAAGFRDHLASPSVCLIEWPEKAEAWLGAADVVVQISVQASSEREATRRVTFIAHTPSGFTVLRPMQEHP